MPSRWQPAKKAASRPRNNGPRIAGGLHKDNKLTLKFYGFSEESSRTATLMADFARKWSGAKSTSCPLVKHGWLVNDGDMLRILTFFAGLWFALSLQAAAIKLDTMQVGDRVYTNVTITSFSATDVYSSHSRGVANEKIRNIDPSVKKLLDYNPTAAQSAEKQQEQADRRYEGALATAIAS